MTLNANGEEGSSEDEEEEEHEEEEEEEAEEELEDYGGGFGGGTRFRRRADVRREGSLWSKGACSEHGVVFRGGFGFQRRGLCF